MTVLIAGINHTDPTMRQELVKWLTECSAGFAKPDFIAVEWDREIYWRVNVHRARFRRLLKEQWVDASEGLLNTLTLSLGYEGDSHLEVFPADTVETLWLDEGRQYREGDIARFAEHRLALYRWYLPDWPQGATDLDILSRISQGAANDVGPLPEAGDERDAKFARRIAQRIAQGVAHNWAIAVVGKNHALEIQGSMLRLLECGECNCKVEMFRGRASQEV